MLSNVENGGSFDGESLHCGEGHTIYMLIIDAAGNPLNGIIVRAVYTENPPVTGTKGAGRTEINLFAGGGDELLAGAVELALELRQAARANKDFATGDAIRDGLGEAGLALEDRPGGTEWSGGNDSTLDAVMSLLV